MTIVRRHLWPWSTSRRIALCAAILLSLVATASPARAEIKLTPALAGNPRSAEIAPRAYFSEQSAVIDLVLSGAQSCPDVVATLVQITTRLEAEVAQQQLFDCGRSPASFTGAEQTHMFQFTVPKVKRESRFEWRFAECGTPGDACRGLIDIPVDVFPADILASIRNWASRESLLVKDPSGALAEFLDQQRIEFIERRSAITKGSQVVSLLVEDKKKIQQSELTPYLERGGVVVFRKSPDTLPLIKSRHVAGRSLISVELPLIEILAGNPRAHKAFLEIFQTLFEVSDNI